MKYLFSIPDSSKMRTINVVLLLAMNEHKEWFYDDFKIDIAYGCPPSCIWNGGRVESGPKYNDGWSEIIKYYKQYGIDYRLNFTNLLLETKDLKDEYGNSIAQNVNNFGGGVTVTLPLMAIYIENNYKNLRVTWSTSTDYGNNKDEMIDKINELSKKYIVVLPYEFNNSSELNKFAYPNNLELLVAETCMANCPKRKQHQFLTSKVIHEGVFDETVNDCLWNFAEKNKGTKERVIGRNRLLEYQKKGFNRFKISGREFLEQPLASYVYYFVRNDSRLDFLEFFAQFDYAARNNGRALDKTAYYLPPYETSKYESILNFFDKNEKL